MVCLGLKPGVAECKAQTNPLSYSGTPMPKVGVFTRVDSESTGLLVFDLTLTFHLAVSFQQKKAWTYPFNRKSQINRATVRPLISIRILFARLKFDFILKIFFNQPECSKVVQHTSFYAGNFIYGIGNRFKFKCYNIL